MKVKIILALVLMNLTIGERRLRSTVLTDESKKIVEHFDFSNFDKQEALNYLDRQRYDNQIRGKRSRFKFSNKKLEETSNEENDVLKNQANPYNKYYSHTPMLETADFLKQIDNPMTLKSSVFTCYDQEAPTITHCGNKIRSKRGHRRKKKHKLNPMQSKVIDDISTEFDYEENEQEVKRRKKKKKKKRHYWNNWSPWSPCSVTCGKGRKVRWRKCIVKDCKSGEVEMGEKTCQLPACNLLTKLLGFG